MRSLGLVVMAIDHVGIDDPREALGYFIQWFLMKFTEEKYLVTNGPTDGLTDRPTDRPTDRSTNALSYRDAWTDLKIEISGSVFKIDSSHPGLTERVAVQSQRLGGGVYQVGRWCQTGKAAWLIRVKTAWSLLAVLPLIDDSWNNIPYRFCYNFP